MIATILSLLKSLFPFIKEALSVDDDLRSSDRRLKFFFLSLLVISLLVGWLGILFVSHTEIVNSSEIDKLHGKIELLEESTQDTRMRLLEERTTYERTRYDLERANNTIIELRRKTRSLEQTIRESEFLLGRLEEAVRACPSPEVDNLYSRLLELYGDD